MEDWPFIRHLIRLRFRFCIPYGVDEFRVYPAKN
jgi:hypothetical protein